MNKSIQTILAILTGFLFTISAQAEYLNLVKSVKPVSTYAPNQLIVRYKKNKSFKTTFIQTQSMTLESRSLGIMKNGEEISVVKIKKNVQLQSALATYKADPNVLAVSYDYYLELYFAPNDLKYISNPNVMWGLNDTAPDLTPFVGNRNSSNNDKTIGNDIDAELAWDIWNKVSVVNKLNVIVAVIDSGVDYTHPDLIGAMWDGSNATVAGQPSPTTKHGRNVADNVNDPYPATSSHGTHVAGTIAATANNAIGIPGIASGVKIMAVKVSSEMDDFILNSSLISGINYAIENGADIINMSLGGGGPEDAVLTSVMKDAVDAGISIVVAAGNSGLNNDIKSSWPANYANHRLTKSNVISVAWTDQADLLSKFSNYGVNTVSISAPGENIMSTIRGLENLKENMELGGAVPGLSSGVGGNPLCSNNPNTCFAKTIFSNPAGLDCVGTNCRWGWQQKAGVLPDPLNGGPLQTLVLYADNTTASATRYGNSINGTITSRIINTSGKKSILTYEALWDLECGSGNNDYIDVEVFDGTKWVLLKKNTVLNLNNPATNGNSLNICQSLHSITGHMSKFPVNPGDPPIGFVTLFHDLSQYSNANMRVRFTFVTNAQTNTTNIQSGFQMQNVRVTTQVSDYTKAYGFKSGTSMSSPHVAGIAALIKGAFPSYTGAQIKTAILNAGDSITLLASKIQSGKRANAYNAIKNASPLVEQQPILQAISDKNIIAGDTLSFTITATDVNGITPVISISGEPANATFTDKLNGTATFSWLTTDSDVRIYNVSFTATDGNTATPGSDVKTVKITVTAKSGSGTGSTTPAPSTNNSDSGGCTLNNKARFDPTLPAFLLLLSAVFLVRKKKKQ